MTGRPHTIAVIALIVFSRGPQILDGGSPILSRSVTGAVGAGQTPVKKNTPSQKTELTTKAARLAFIRKAQVWAPTAVSRMDLRAGPEGPGAFHPNEAVTCD